MTDNDGTSKPGGRWKPADSLLLKIREEIARRDMGYGELSEQSGVNRNTLNQFMRGVGSSKTQFQICSYLKIVDGLSGYKTGITSDDMGAYHKDLALAYEGTYTWARPTFHDPTVISVFPLEISWVDEDQCLKMFSQDEWGNSVEADVNIPRHTSIHITTRNKGFCSLTILNSVTDDGNYYGMMLSLGWEGPNRYNPACVPTIITSDKTVFGKTARNIAPGEVHYDKLSSLLSRVTAESWAKVVEFQRLRSG